MKWSLPATALALILINLGPARADPRLDEVVYTPYIQNGVAEFELRNAQALGGPIGGSATTVLEAEYGLNDRFSLALVGTIARQPDQSLGLDGVGRSADEGLDLQVLFDCLEEQFNLPAIFVNGRDGGSAKTKMVSEEDERFARILTDGFDPAQ